MNRAWAKIVAGELVLGLFLAAAAHAQSPQSSGSLPSGMDGLTPNDRMALDIATETSTRITAIIKGWISTGEMSEDKLFSFMYFPIPDTDPPKYNTAYDTLADRDIRDIQEQALKKSKKISYVVLVDKNGYLPTHNQRYSQPLTKRKQIDLVNNRTKQIFNDKIGRVAAHNTKPFLIQAYARRPGDELHDLAVPIFIGDRHWGALRVGYNRQ